MQSVDLRGRLRGRRAGRQLSLFCTESSTVVEFVELLVSETVNGTTTNPKISQIFGLETKTAPDSTIKEKDEIDPCHSSALPEWTLFGFSPSHWNGRKGIYSLLFQSLPDAVLGLRVIWYNLRSPEAFSTCYIPVIGCQSNPPIPRSPEPDD